MSKSFRLENYLYGQEYFNPAVYLENYKYLALLRKRFKIFVVTMKDKEADFVAEKGKTIIYFQVVYIIEKEKTMQREIDNLLSIKDNYQKILITMDDFIFGNINGIRHIRAWEVENSDAFRNL